MDRKPPCYRVFIFPHQFLRSGKNAIAFQTPLIIGTERNLHFLPSPHKNLRFFCTIDFSSSHYLRSLKGGVVLRSEFEKVTITEISVSKNHKKRQWHFRDLNSKSSHYRNLSVSKNHKFWCGSGKIIDFTQFPLFAKFERQWHFRDLNSKSSHYRNLIV